MVDFSGRVAFVNGGAGGIGSAVSRQLVQAGASVAIADIDLDRARALCEELETPEVSCMAVHMDVRDVGSVEAAVAAASEKLGLIDCLFNVTGITGPNIGLSEVAVEDFDDVWAVNLRGYLLTLQSVVRRLKAAGRCGSVVNVGSGGGVRPGGQGGLPSYCVAKAAVHAFSQAAARELAPHKIRVNAVVPGPVLTPMTQGAQNNPEARKMIEARVPLGVMADPDDIASFMLFVASDAGRNITGAVLANDGGATL